MPILEKHIIHKVTVDVFTGSLQSGEFLRQNLRDFLEEEIFPFIENYFDKLRDYYPEGSLQMDAVSLDIQLDTISNNQRDKAFFLHALSKQLERIFTEIVPTDVVGGKRLFPTYNPTDRGRFTSQNNLLKEDSSQLNFRWLSSTEKSFLAWLSFLEFGDLPWWGISEKPGELDERLIASWKVLPDFQKKLMKSISSFQVRKRLILQHTPAEIIRLIGYLETRLFKSHDNLINTVAYIGESSFADGRWMTWLVLELVVSGEEQAESKHANDFSLPQSLFTEINGKSMGNFIELLRGFIPENYRINLERILEGVQTSSNYAKPSSNPDNSTINQRFGSDVLKGKFSHRPSNSTEISENKAIESPLGERILANAGSILLHPFLAAFFRDCGVLTKDNRFSDPGLAVHLLHYAATGDVSAPDYELQFEKFIIGIPVEMPVDRFIPLPLGHKEKVQELLDSLLENWQKLKNTSADTVRVEFLQRSGKIQREGDQIRIIMDRKVQDILLDSLPFNLGMLKLPWRRELIIVAW